MNKNVLWITRTALFTALLIVMQAATATFGNTLITGSIVNLILIISVMICGSASGLAVAAISPACAKFFGIGPLWSLIPFIIAGNLVLALVWNLIGNRGLENKHISYIIAMLAGAVAKFFVLYIGIVRIAIPLLLQLPEPQAAVISSTFSIRQLFTALIGGGLALVILPVLQNALKDR